MFAEVRALVDQRSEAVLQRMNTEDRMSLERGLAALHRATESVADEL